MKTEWDYTDLAEAYLATGLSDSALRSLFELCGLSESSVSVMLVLASPI